MWAREATSSFRSLSSIPILLYYVVVNVERFKPVRQTLNVVRVTVFAPRIMIFWFRHVCHFCRRCQGRICSQRETTDFQNTGQGNRRIQEGS